MPCDNFSTSRQLIKRGLLSKPTLPMVYVDPGQFYTELMSCLTERRNIPWVQTILTQPEGFSFSPENEGLIDSVCVVATAIEVISVREIWTHAEEFHLLVDILGDSATDFRSFFTSCVPFSFLRFYTAYGFIRYLSYTLCFSMHCYSNGYLFTPDHAVFAVMEVTRSLETFSSIWGWNELVVQSIRIIQLDGSAIRPYLPLARRTTVTSDVSTS